MPDEVRTQHLIDVLDYIEQLALTRTPEDAIKEIKVYCADLIQIAKWYKELDQYQAQYNAAREVWRKEGEEETLESNSLSRLKPRLIDNAC